jgi:hypothetical protein
VGDENCSCLTNIIVLAMKWVGLVIFDYNVGQTGTGFITHFKDLWSDRITPFCIVIYRQYWI